uniref:Uncharacterized protein n=1 Tax=Knipowitschia caucasica TaxID=637954 RepID=A0AAV2L8H5_KNICA
MWFGKLTWGGLSSVGVMLRVLWIDLSRGLKIWGLCCRAEEWSEEGWIWTRMILSGPEHFHIATRKKKKFVGGWVCCTGCGDGKRCGQ